jgi:hypothetical protein
LGRIVLAAIVTFAFLSPALAANERLLASLRKLDPDTRLEQVCDLEAMNQVNQQGFAADRAKSDILSRPRHNGDTLTANGGAFRSRGKWYRLSFVCQGSRDHLHVTSFQYRVGSAIPEAKWPSLGLWR